MKYFRPRFFIPVIILIFCFIGTHAAFADNAVPLVPTEPSSATSDTASQQNSSQDAAADASQNANESDQPDTDTQADDTDQPTADTPDTAQTPDPAHSSVTPDVPATATDTAANSAIDSTAATPSSPITQSPGTAIGAGTPADEANTHQLLASAGAFPIGNALLLAAILSIFMLVILFVKKRYFSKKK